MSDKIPFNIDEALHRIETAVAPFPQAALFELADEGCLSVFEQLVACILSIRTYDETMLPVAKRLFAVARTPEQMAALSPAQIDEIIGACTFHEPKSRTIHALAQRAVAEFGGALPCDENTLLSLHGVGPKCANLVLGIACGIPKIGVDIHVHRVTIRWVISPPLRLKRACWRWKKRCPSSIMSPSIACWCRSVSIFAPARCRNAQPARCWRCVSRLE